MEGAHAVMRLVVVGGVAAGTKAASRARRVAPGAEITIYQEEPDPSISECGLPYFLSGKVPGRDRLVARTPEDFARNDIGVLVSHRVEAIDPGAKKLSVRNLATGEEFEDRYDRLLISTGARAILPPIPGADLGGVFLLRFLTDADRILAYIEKHSPRRVAIIGGGYIGLEVAENLRELGMEVTLIQASDRVAANHDPEISERVEAHLAQKGVEVHTSANVEKVSGDGRVRSVHFGGRDLDTDLVVIGVGIKPSVELASEAGAETGKTTDAIRVDRQMRTSLPDVWAAGDCVESVNLASGEPAWIPLGDTANQMGRVAGTNAVLDPGDKKTLEFPGVLGTGIFKVFDMGVGRTGLSERDAEQAGFQVASAGIDSVSKASYYPGAGKVFIKLICDVETGRLLGADIAGDGADKLVDVCATAIWGRLTIPDLVNIDLAYAPPFGPALSPVTQVATILSGRLGRNDKGS